MSAARVLSAPAAAAAIASERLVFVAGLHRSGTTPLARWLAASPHVTGLRDTGVWENEGQHLQDLLPTAIQHGGPGRFAFAPKMHEVETSPRATPALARRLLEAWAPYWELERPLLLEKSPPNLLRTRLLQALFPGAAFVVVIRHPVAVALATEKWLRRPGRWVAAPSLLRHWLRAHELFLADAPRLERLIVVRYEELIADPGAVMQRVGAFLGLPQPPPVPDDAARGSDEDYFAAWRAARPLLRRALTAGAPLAFERRVARFGYSLRDLRAHPAPDPLLTSVR